MAQTEAYAKQDTLEPLVLGRGESNRKAIAHAVRLSTLSLSLPHGANVTTLREEVDLVYGRQDESYTLSIPGTSSASIFANTSLGLLRGMQTFSQLVYFLPAASGSAGTRYILNTPIEVVDAPAFPHRYLSLLQLE